MRSLRGKANGSDADIEYDNVKVYDESHIFTEPCLLGDITTFDSESLGSQFDLCISGHGAFFL